MKVYRLENKDCLGPYWSWKYSDVKKLTIDHGNHFYRMKSNHQSDFDNHPSINKIDRFTDGKHFCGFKTKKQLNSWFTKKDQLVLKLMGFEISVYEVDKKYTNSDNFQVYFEKEKAIKIA